MPAILYYEEVYTNATISDYVNNKSEKRPKKCHEII
jgi:hypothetical protein